MWVQCYNYETSGLWDFWPLLLGGAFCVIGFLVTTNEWKQKKEARGGCGMVFLYLWTAFALFWTLGVGYDIGSKYFRLKAVLQQQQYQQVEGPVENWGIYLHQRTQTEFDTFSVQQVPFRIPQRELSPVPEGMDGSGRAVVNGRKVRIWYEGGQILRLWVWAE